MNNHVLYIMGNPAYGDVHKIGYTGRAEAKHRIDGQIKAVLGPGVRPLKTAPVDVRWLRTVEALAQAILFDKALHGPAIINEYFRADFGGRSNR